MRELFALLAAVLSVAGCASEPPAATVPAVRDHTAGVAARHADAMMGKPYRYGGSLPDGFDCSGLVHYSYARSGFATPRDTRGLHDRSRPVSIHHARPGDLLFFDEGGKKRSHVGIYLGDDRFVHAPSSGGRVRIDHLSAGYWHKTFVEARQLSVAP